MFPSYQAFRTFEEFQKTVQLCIPPCNFSIHSLHFHNQMTITNRTIRHPINRVLPEPKLESPTRDSSVRFDPHSSGVGARAFPEKQHNQSPGAAENVMGVNFGGGNGGDGLGPQDLFLLMDGFDESGSEEGKSSQQKKEPENSVESLSPAAKRHRRMIKNRESAARSRARKQAYTTQLEIEVAQLRKENELLRKAKRLPDDPAIARRQPGPSQQRSRMRGQVTTSCVLHGDIGENEKEI